MKIFKTTLFIISALFLLNLCACTSQDITPVDADNMLIRIAEIEVYPGYQKEYISILKEEAAASVKKEPGVIAIFPMVKKEDSAEIRILEIYKNQAAYESHLQTPHFKHYKTSTAKMVKSLKLMDMRSIDQQSMPKIFQKLKAPQK